MADKPKEYVAYGELGAYKPGDVVNPADWDLEQWKYMVEHQVVVPKNSQNDPNVLEEAAAEARDTIAEQSAQNDQPAQLSAAELAHKAATSGSSDTKDEKSSADDKPEPTPDAGDTTTKAAGDTGTNKPSPTPPADKPPAPATVKAATPEQTKKA
jgi:hypothetical protein